MKENGGNPIRVTLFGACLSLLVVGGLGGCAHSGEKKASIAAPEPTAAPLNLADCEVEKLEGRRRFYECGEVTLLTAPVPADVNDVAALQGILSDFEESAKLNGEPQHAEVLAGGRKHAALRLSAQMKPKAQIRGLFVALTGPGELRRAVACLEPDPAPPTGERCPGAMEALIREPLSEQPSDFFEGCELTRTASGGVTATCSEIFVSAEERPVGPDGEAALLDEEIASLKEMADWKVEKTRLQVAGKERLGAELRSTMTREDKTLTLEGALVVLPAEGNRRRVAWCMTREGSRALCGDAFEAIAQAMPEPKPPKAPTLAGRPLTVIEGCEQESHVISCGRDVLLWRELPEGESRKAMLLDAYREAFKQAESFEEHTWSCEIEGQPTECHQLIRSANGGRIQWFLGFARVRGTFLLVQCQTDKTALEEGLDPPCDQVIKLGARTDGAKPPPAVNKP